MYQMCRINIEESEGSFESLKLEIKRLAGKIRLRWNVERIILYGSVARGDYNEASDVDLIVVADFKERFHKRPGEIMEMTELPVEAICYTKEEFEDMLKRQNPFVCTVIDEGILI